MTKRKVKLTMQWIWRLAVLLIPYSGADAETNATALPFDPAQLPHVSGVVSAYALVPGGKVDGLLLENGMQILTAPPLSEQVVRAVKPGDKLTAYGMKATTAPVWLALALVSEKSREPVILGDIPLLLALGGTLPHHAPPPGTESAQRPLGTSTELNGKVTREIYGPRGGVDGALLDDGTIVRVPMTEAERVTPLLKPGSRVFVRGVRSSSAQGTLFIAEAIGSSRQSLIVLAPWDGPR